MGWIFSIGFMIYGAIYHDAMFYVVAGLFAIAGSIAFSSISKK